MMPRVMHSQQSLIHDRGSDPNPVPGANANPYEVIVSLAETTVMNSESYSKFDESSDKVSLSYGAEVDLKKTELGVRGVGFQSYN